MSRRKVPQEILTFGNSGALASRFQGLSPEVPVVRRMPTYPPHPEIDKMGIWTDDVEILKRRSQAVLTWCS